MTFVLRRESRLFGLMIIASMLMGVAGCSDVRRAIGTEKSTPDEFQVVVRLSKHQLLFLYKLQ